MRIQANSSAMVYGNNYKAKNASQAKEDLPAMKRQLANEEKNLASLLKTLGSFGKTHALIGKNTEVNIATPAKQIHSPTQNTQELATSTAKATGLGTKLDIKS